jgi:hypothetical protein
LRFFEESLKGILAEERFLKVIGLLGRELEGTAYRDEGEFVRTSAKTSLACDMARDIQQKKTT